MCMATECAFLTLLSALHKLLRSSPGHFQLPPGLSNSLLFLTFLPSSLAPFLSVRARIEKEYGDNLVRLAEKSAGKEEIG